MYVALHPFQYICPQRYLRSISIFIKTFGLVIFTFNFIFCYSSSNSVNTVCKSQSFVLLSLHHLFTENNSIPLPLIFTPFSVQSFALKTSCKANVNAFGDSMSPLQTLLLIEFVSLFNVKIIVAFS